MIPKRPGKIIVYLLLGLTLELYLLSKDSLSALGFNVFITVAQLAALFGTVLFAVSFMLAARTHLVEETFGGLDRAYRVHHKTGVWSFSLLAVHMAAVLIGYGLLGVPLLETLTSSPAFITGEIGLLLMAAIALTIIFAKVPYQLFVTLRRMIDELLGRQSAEEVIINHSRHCQCRIFRIQLFPELFFLYPLFNYIDQNIERLFQHRLDNGGEVAGRVGKLAGIIAQKVRKIAIALD